MVLKRINGKSYNTESAKNILKWSSDYPKTDFHWSKCELFCKRTGEYFIYGCGNAASKFKHYNCKEDMCEPSEKIIPVTVEEAKKIVLEYGNEELYKKEFEAPFNNEKKKEKMVSLRESTIAKIKKNSLKEGVSFSEVIDRAFED